MGVIEDVRKVIQDLVAPELKSIQVELKRIDETSKLRDEALSAKIGHLDEALSAKIGHLDEALSARIEHLSEKMDRQLEIVLNRMDANHQSILYTLNIEKRVEAIERKTAPMQAA